MLYFVSAFSLNMLKDFPVTIKFDEIPESHAKHDLITADNLVTTIGHESTARVLSEHLGFLIEAERLDVELKPGDEIIVAQVTRGAIAPEAGATPSATLPRLAEGEILTDEQVANAAIRYLWGKVKSDN